MAMALTCLGIELLRGAVQHLQRLRSASALVNPALHQPYDRRPQVAGHAVRQRRHISWGLRRRVSLILELAATDGTEGQHREAFMAQRSPHIFPCRLPSAGANNSAFASCLSCGFSLVVSSCELVEQVVLGVRTQQLVYKCADTEALGFAVQVLQPWRARGVHTLPAIRVPPTARLWCFVYANTRTDL